MNEELAKAIAFLYGTFHKADDIAGQKAYALILKDIPADILNEAIGYFTNEQKWLPSAAEVKEKAREIWTHRTHLAKEAAWQEIAEFASGGPFPKSELGKKIIKVCGAEFLKENKNDIGFIRGYYSLYAKDADFVLPVHNIVKSLGVQ